MMRNVTLADFDLVYDYVLLRARKDELDEQVKEMGLWITMTLDRGKKAKRINPMHTESMKIVPILNQMRQELGFGPAARQKVRMLGQLEKSDKMEDFLDNL